MMDDLAVHVINVVALHLGLDLKKVTEHSSFIDDLGADSLDVIELVMAFEEEFDIDIPDDAAEHIQTVEDAISHIRSAKADHASVAQVGRTSAFASYYSRFRG